MKKNSRKLPRFYLVLMFIISAVVISAGIIFYSLLRERSEEDIKSELSSIMKIKTNQVVSWREERLSEARYYYTNSIFLQQVEKFINSKDNRDYQMISGWIRTMQENHYYAIFITDTTGQVVYSSLKKNLPLFHKNEIDSTIKLKTFWMNDIIPDEKNNLVHFSVYVPLIKSSSKSPFAVMVMIIDPHKDLYPLIKVLPGRLESVESVMFRREGDSVIYLSDLKNQPNSAFYFTLPLSKKNLAAAKVIQGNRGIFEAIDYKGEKVIASGDIIPGTNWFLYTKVNRNEVDNSIFLYSALTLIIIIALLFAAAALIALLAWRRESGIFEKLYKSEQEKLALKEHYELFIKQANDIILLMDYNGNIIDANKRAEEIYGYSHQELTSMNIIQLRVPENLDQVKNLTDYSSEEGVIYESAHRKKSGEVIFIEASSKIIQVNGYKYIQNIVRDITDRKLNEIKLRKLNRLYLYLTKVNELIIRETDSLLLYQKFTDASIETGTFMCSAVGLINADTKNIVVAASSGPQRIINVLERGAYLKTITENIIMSGRHFISNDIENDPSLSPWYETALQEGFKAYAVYPLRENSRLTGILLFFSGEKNFFDREEISLLNDLSNNLSYAVTTLLKERKRRTAEEAVRQSELNLKTLAANFPDTYTFLFNRKLEIITAEGNDLTLFNMSAEEIKDKDISLLFGDKLIPKEKFMEVFEGKRNELEVRTEGRIYNILIYPVKGEGGISEAGITVVQNITNRKTSEETLRSTEVMLSSFFNLTNVFMNIMELRGDDVYFVESNHRMSHLLSKAAEELKGKSIREVLGEERHIYWIDIYRNVLKYRRPVTIEFPFTIENKQIWLMVEINLIEVNEGSNPFFSIVGFDITERKNIEEALQQSEERFRSFIESNIIGITFGDISGRIKFANDRYLNIIGYSREELEEGKINWKEITPPEYHSLDLEKLDQAKARGECEPYYKEYNRKDGTRVKVLIGFVLLGEKREETIAFILDSSLPDSRFPEPQHYSGKSL